ncbi:hypothetical protein D8B26_005108 [Coccidioides posadasii str. Silveira]|uniref:Box C/D snoRNA protein 1 n=2 Tax=Coccidioides posadasii TaxID=199306 RepID=E9D5V2_COCPS|nr:conserved hypothetical protein [Coccidioides posadasii str. Silveira]KMM66321.1 hypothetical protein CPAG_02660 [Coccidioides posadasii RMSCC 3488]QVM10447.1 hypothetical protein D8B26_005108 [Coccidioides posadasii str. Silveira]
MAGASLSELCTICHTHLPKYTCPRCSTRTCSLPCSKRHKLWSQCSGVRDPAAYLKRKELATPAAFDKDFNFITEIERCLERADRDAENRGIMLEDEERSKKKRRTGEFTKGEALLRRIEESGVDVIRAPKGMTRSRQNMSQWHKKHKCVNWTVEWIFPDGQKTITRCLETITIGTAFSRTPYAKEHDLVEKEQTSKAKPMRSIPSSDSKEEPEPRPELDAGKEITGEASRDGGERSRTLTPEESLPLTGQSNPEQLSTKTEDQNTSTNEKGTPKISPEIHLYLHRPRTRANIPVLVPLPASVTLSEALRGRKVLEFPTLYALSLPPDQLAGGEYMLEADYLAQYGAEEKMAEEQGNSDGQGVGQYMADEAQKLENVDESKVLEVLNKDLGGEE